MSVAASRPYRLASLAAVVVLVAAACGAGPALADPREILTKAVEALQKAKTVHLAATVDGSFVLDLTGTGGGAMSLTGTTLDGDVDVASKKAKLTFAVPALLGLAGEVIAIDGASYVKTTLTGDLYQKSAGTDSLPVDPTDPEATLTEVKSWLDKPEVSPKKLDDVDCDGKKCYQVTIELTGAELAALESPAPSATPDPNTNVLMTFLVEKDPVRLHRLTAVVAVGASGTLTIVLNLSKWDESVTIEAPPADQIGEGTGLPF